METAPGAIRPGPGIAVKLAVCLVASAAAILACLGWQNLRLERRHAEELTLTSAERLSDIIVQSTRHEMLRNDRAALYDAIRDIGHEPGIRRVRIFNKEGRISFSTDQAEVGHIVDKQTEACYACHAQGVPLERLKRPDSARLFQESDGKRVLAIIRPIRNEASCSSADCHAHSPEKKVLGVIDAHLSLAAVDAQLARQQVSMISFSALALVVLCGISLLWVWTVIHRPIKALMAGTQRVADGDLDYRIEIPSRDELGQLASSFNSMTADLAAAHQEITTWNQTLEDRVQTKTEELERAHAYLVTSEKLAGIGKLAATVAHEVNNPLFGILTYARLCRKELEKPDLEQEARARMMNAVRTIEHESRRCGDLIRNLLTYSRQTPRNREPHDIEVIIERAVALVRHQFEMQGIELEVSCEENLPRVTCDSAQIQQLLLVLLTNAAEATGNGGHVSLSAVSEDGQLRIRVRDDGPGISPDVLPRIFEPFFTTKEDKVRTGLGLAVAKSIAEQHSGDLQARSAPGEGAEFSLTLPLSVAVTAAGGQS